MKQEQLLERIKDLHQSPTTLALVCTGAGAGAQALLASVPGASATILECQFPYAQGALAEYLGFAPQQFASQDTAIHLAARAWRRACRLAHLSGGSVGRAVGIAGTGVIATNVPKRGEHRFHMAIRSGEGFHTCTLTFPKNGDNSSVLGRETESALCDRALVHLALGAAGLHADPFIPSHVTGDVRGTDGGARFLVPSRINIDPETVVPDPEKHVLFDGSFNPLQHGHEQMALEVEMRTGKRVVYVIERSHPDKGPVPEDELRWRLGQFACIAPVHVTDGCPRYVEKAEANPGFSRIIGADTVRRMLDPKYGLATPDVLRRLKDAEAHFFVADRPHGEHPAALDEILKTVPPGLHNLFTKLGTVMDVSSTAIRETVAAA